MKANEGKSCKKASQLFKKSRKCHKGCLDDRNQFRFLQTTNCQYAKARQAVIKNRGGHTKNDGFA